MGFRLTSTDKYNRKKTVNLAKSEHRTVKAALPAEWIQQQNEAIIQLRLDRAVAAATEEVTENF